ncbi:AraC family transcriptional regulator [Streptomyces viridochromogenes]|uniref:AraC family transcriptional regulator n=1 Tax=Streptomyces viridochromogenes TaxID=1938 RepID=A0A0L8L0W8_STRVR|nr:AraC family transcriptional regulator [Streptomyces viridochromogenes]KOG31721.1 AraC family transcriptional regulator [Streptomyces viridochromogenes]
MWSVVSAGELPARERFDWFEDLVTREVMPTALSVERPADFQAEAAVLDLRDVRVARFAFSPLRSRRTPALIRRGDPEQYQLGLIRQGVTVLSQHRNDCSAGAGDLLFWDTSRPSAADMPTASGPVRLTLLQLPRDVLPLRPQRVDRLLGSRIPGGHGVGAVLAAFLDSLEGHAGQCAPDDLPRLGSVVVDLVAACLAQNLDADDQLPAEARARALIQRIHDFVETHLGDPDLTPAAVAAGHHVSVRTLHQLFRAYGDGETVQARIRRRRLERCRDDLARPELLGRPVQAVAARWGFSGPAVFSRTFRAAYGLSPTEFRALSVKDVRAERTAGRAARS